jgi:hypothetical protein
MNVSWRQYRDESQRAPIVKVAEAAQAFKTKAGAAPNVLGVPPNFPADVRKTLAEKYQVLVCVPAWAKSEIWIGIEEKAG